MEREQGMIKGANEVCLRMFFFKSFHQIVSTWFFRTSSALLKIRGGVKTLTWRLFLPRKRGIRELNFIFAFAYLRAV